MPKQLTTQADFTCRLMLEDRMIVAQPVAVVRLNE